MSGQTNSNPLKQNQVIHPVRDISVIAKSHGETHLTLSATETSSTSGMSVLDSAKLDNLTEESDILDIFSAYSMQNYMHPVYFLTGTTGQYSLNYGHIDSGSLAVNSVSLTSDGVIGIAGIDTTYTDKDVVLLYGVNTSGAYIQSVDMKNSNVLNTTQISGLDGSPVTFTITQNQLRIHLIALTEKNNNLYIADLGTSLFGNSPKAPSSISATEVGDYSSEYPPVVRSSLLIASSGSESVSIAYIDNNSAYQLTVFGWDTSGAFSNLACSAISSETPAEGPSPSTFSKDAFETIKMDTGDLINAGTDQIFIAVPAVFDNVAGCAALFNFTLESGSQAATGYSLSLTSTYVIANSVTTGSGKSATTLMEPFCSNGLEIAVGIFGEVTSKTGSGTMGVALVGIGSTASQLFKGEASVLSCIISVNPTSGYFPPIDSKPITPLTMTTLQTVSDQITKLVCTPSDLQGQSAVLGSPVMTEGIACEQVLAILHAPPFAKGITSEQLLTFGESKNKSTGCSTTTTKTWTWTKDSGENLGIGSLNLSHNLVNTYGHDFSNTDDHTVTKDISYYTNMSKEDVMILYSLSYDIWTYPLYRKAVMANQDGHITVLFPQEASSKKTLTELNSDSFGYVPEFEPGKILSYNNNTEQLNGYKEKNLIFTPNSFPVNTNSSTQATFTISKMNENSKDNGLTLFTNTTDSADFAIHTNLFKYLPISFNMNLSQSHDYNYNKTKSTTVSFTNDISITVQFGQVTEENYDYQVTPYIYQHETLGCMVIDYTVTLTGLGWKNELVGAGLLMRKVYPFYQDGPMISSFTRDIVFTESDDNLTVTANVLNASYDSPFSATVAIYEGKPTKDSEGNLKVPSGTALTSKDITKIKPCQTESISTTLAKPSGKKYFTVEVTSTVGGNVIYWGVYPYSEFSQLYQSDEKQNQSLIGRVLRFF